MQIIKKSIGEKQGGLYWVNPVLFSGNRQKFIVETYGLEYVHDVKEKKPSAYTEVDEF
jgi:hypothetical protein